MSTLKENSTGGPRTPQGKLRASRNARKHGLLAVEFRLSAEESVEFHRFAHRLRKALKPDTALLDLIFEDIVACAWRLKLALRCEHGKCERNCKSSAMKILKSIEMGNSARIRCRDFMEI